METSLATTEPRSLTTQAVIFDPVMLHNMQAMAEAMATARITVPKHLVGSPGDCLAIVMQSAQWQMNPYAVAQKTHVVNGALGYEAQLVNAVVSNSSLLDGRIDYQWEGDWKGVNGKADKSDERACTVSCRLKGESMPRVLRVSMAQVGDVRNSPLWVSDPRQQLAYLATKRWARLHAPDVLLGVYTADELQDAVERNMGPAEVLPPPSASRTESIKAKLKIHTASPVEVISDLDRVLVLISEASNNEQLGIAATEAGKLTDANDKRQARAVYKAKIDAMRAEDEADAQAEREAIQEETDA